MMTAFRASFPPQQEQQQQEEQEEQPKQPKQAPLVLGNVTNTKSRRIRYAKNILLTKSKALTPIKENPESNDPTPQKSPSPTSKVFKYAQWRNLQGSLRLTNTALIFKPHPCTGTKAATKRLLWNQVYGHQARTIELRDSQKHLLKITMAKNGEGASCSMILRFSNAGDLQEVDHAIQLHLLQQNAMPTAVVQESDEKPVASVSQYAMVQWNGTIPGSLVLDADQLLFQPCSAKAPVITVAWAVVQQHQRLFRDQTTLLQLKCTGPVPTFVLQMSSWLELKRLVQDITDRIDSARARQKKQAALVTQVDGRRAVQPFKARNLRVPLLLLDASADIFSSQSKPRQELNANTTKREPTNSIFSRFWVLVMTIITLSLGAQAIMSSLPSGSYGNLPVSILPHERSVDQDCVPSSHLQGGVPRAGMKDADMENKKTGEKQLAENGKVKKGSTDSSSKMVLTYQILLAGVSLIRQKMADATTWFLGETLVSVHMSNIHGQRLELVGTGIRQGMENLCRIVASFRVGRFVKTFSEPR
jgi:hypothetical protein